jgi:hypothetical protein
MLAFGRAAHNPSPSWKVFPLLKFPKIINAKPYLSATISIIGILYFFLNSYVRKTELFSDFLFRVGYAMQTHQILHLLKNL